MEHILIIKKFKMSGQNTEFIAETIDLSITVVNRMLRKIHECEEQDNDFHSLCKKWFKIYCIRLLGKSYSITSCARRSNIDTRKIYFRNTLFFGVQVAKKTC